MGACNSRMNKVLQPGRWSPGAHDVQRLTGFMERRELVVAGLGALLHASGATPRVPDEDFIRNFAGVPASLGDEPSVLGAALSFASFRGYEVRLAGHIDRGLDPKTRKIWEETLGDRRWVDHSPQSPDPELIGELLEDKERPWTVLAKVSDCHAQVFHDGDVCTLALHEPGYSLRYPASPGRLGAAAMGGGLSVLAVRPQQDVAHG